MKDVKCPKCESKHIIKKGKRRRNYVVLQIYLCKECGRTFTDKKLRYKTYPARIVYNAINYYNLGHSLDETRKLLNKKFKVLTSKTTIHNWIVTFKDICPISLKRKNILNYDDVLFTKKFEHENLDYEFMYHKYKMDVMARKRFFGLSKYITRFEDGCPDEFFEVGERCSQPKFVTKITSIKRTNLACKMASFAVQARVSNRERHDLVEKFMIINDTATIACEVPVWYWEKSINSGITGHIDIVQVRGDYVYILDYKPGASKDKKAPQQLYHYAVALSFRAKIPFEHIRCAWFDENVYYEYNPIEADVKLVRN
jgi:transposase-like protein